MMKSVLIATATIVLSAISFSAQAHVADCTRVEGVAKERCERHMKIAEKCGAIKGEAHYVCDQEFLLANPLNCPKYAAVGPEADALSCKKELDAVKTCGDKKGREFIKCVSTTAGASPMG
jgi:hypothetical protein